MAATLPNITAEAPRFTDRMEAWGAALLFAVFRFLPLDWASATGAALARRIGPFLAVSRHARRNIRRAFPELSESEVTGVVISMWDNLGRVAAEYPHLRKINVFEPGGRVETRGLEHVDRAIAAGRRMIVFSGHIANWEIGMLAGLQYGIPVAQIYRAANNPLVDRMIARFRGNRGEFIPKGAIAARGAIAALRRGTHLGLLADQKMNDGIPVPFFGRPAMTASALAVLALRFDCDVLPLRVERLDGARFRVTVYPPLPLPRSGDLHADAAALMARVNAGSGGMDPRPASAMALGAPTLAGVVSRSRTCGQPTLTPPTDHNRQKGRRRDLGIGAAQAGCVAAAQCSLFS